MAERLNLLKAKDLFQQYLTLNPDIPENTAKVMATFVVAPRVTKDVLRRLLGRERVGQTYMRDRGFYWWNAFALAGLAEEWEWFAQGRNGGERFDRLLRRLREKIGPEKWELFKRRLGRPSLRIESYDRHSARGTLWTKGGTWYLNSPFTTLLVLKQHLPRRDLYRPFHHKLGHEGIKQIERELMELVDPDNMLAGEARIYACDYVRDRVPELLSWPAGRRMSPKHLGWFFLTNVPYQGKRWRQDQGRPGNVFRRGEIRTWEW